MPKEYYQYEFLLGVGAHKICSSNNDSFDKLKAFYNSYKDWMFGYFSYDLKNEIDKLTSENIDNLNFSNLFFFIPKIVFIMKEGALYVDTFSNKKETDIIIKEIENQVGDEAFLNNFIQAIGFIQAISK